jgi:Tfp pilus assembly protein PilN
VVDLDAVVEALRALLAAADVASRRVSLVLSGSRAVCRVEPLAIEDDPHAWAACEERMRRYVVFGGEPTTVRRVFQACPPEGPWAGRLLGAAAPQSLVARQLEVTKRCGLTVARAEPAMAALARALLSAPDPPPRFLLVAGGDGCEVGILRSDGLIFCHRVRIPREDDPGGGAWLLGALDRLQHYHLRHAGGEAPITEVLCCGMAEGLEEALERLPDAGLTVVWVDPSSFPQVAEFEGQGLAGPVERAAIAAAEAGALTDVVGTAAVSEVSFLPRGAARRRHRLLAPCFFVPLLITLLAVSGLMAWDWAIRREVKHLKYLMDHPTAELLETSRLQRRASTLKQRVAEGERLLRQAPRRNVPALLATLPQWLPGEAWLAQLEIEAGSRCHIEGKAHAEDAVFAFASALRGSPLIDDVRIDRTGSEREGGVILTRFALEVALSDPAEGLGSPRPKAARRRSDPRNPPNAPRDGAPRRPRPAGQRSEAD